MDHNRESVFPGENVVQELAGNSGNRSGGSNHPWIFATGDDCRVWSQEGSVEKSSPKKSRSSPMEVEEVMSRSKAIGKMFYKTKLCYKFVVGACPFVTDCRYAHSYEELKKPPPNWEEIVAAHEEDQQAVCMELGDEFQYFQRPSMWFSRHCKKFSTEEGCPYGDNCTFLHDEENKGRGTDAISLNSPTASNLKPRTGKLDSAMIGKRRAIARLKTSAILLTALETCTNLALFEKNQS